MPLSSRLIATSGLFAVAVATVGLTGTAAQAAAALPAPASGGGYSTSFVPTVADPTTATAGQLAAASGHASRGVTPQVGTSNPGGPITRDEILARAASWLTENGGGPVPYSQTAYWTDSNGTYREDCSGYVSMAWHLVSDASNNYGQTTWTLPNFATAESFSALQPGDILDYTAEHTFLFAGWVDQAAGTFDYYAESNPNDPTHYSEADINDSKLEGWPTSDYTAYRYNNIFTPPPPTSAATFSDGTGRPAALHHADGRLEMLAVSPSGGVENKYETVADGAWSSWNDFGPAGTDVVSVADGVHQDGRVEAFAVTSTGAVLNKYETAPESTWAGWFGFGPSGTVTSLAVARHANGRLEVFAVMSDGSVENKYETVADGAWSGWNDFAPAGTASHLSIGLHADGRLEVFAVTPAGGIENKYETVADGAWSGWNGFGPSGTVANIVVATHHDGRLEVLATLSDGAIDNKFETSPDAAWAGWFGFAPAGTAAAAPGSVDAIQHADGRLEVFAVSPTGAVRNDFETVADGAWSGWNGFGPSGDVTGLDAAAHADGRLEVFATLSDGSIDNKFETAPDASWSGWNSFAPAGTD